LNTTRNELVDARAKPGHDGWGAESPQPNAI
jgi:hypothetical protein